jgi:membrane-associated protein
MIISLYYMESLLSFIYAHASQAHLAIFILFMLAGVNLPISEDLLIIAAATIASQLCPENVWKLYLAVFLGAYLSDSIPYWLGRKFGANLWNMRWVSRMIKRERLEQVKLYYSKYGMLTLLVGRFIPFGVRNCLFAAAGMGRMNYLKFLLSDGLACFISTTTIFSLAYFCETLLLDKLKWVNLTIFLVFLFSLITFICYKVRTRKIA